MKKIIMLLVILCTVSAFSESLTETRPNWRGEWQIEGVSQNGGLSFHPGHNILFGIMTTKSFKSPNGTESSFLFIRETEIDGEEKIFVKLKKAPNKMWVVTNTGPDTLIVVFYSLITRNEMSRIKIKVAKVD